MAERIGRAKAIELAFLAEPVSAEQMAIAVSRIDPPHRQISYVSGTKLLCGSNSSRFRKGASGEVLEEMPLFSLGSPR
jgi:hypothetical protein